MARGGQQGRKKQTYKILKGWIGKKYFLFGGLLGHDNSFFSPISFLSLSSLFSSSSSFFLSLSLSPNPPYSLSPNPPYSLSPPFSLKDQKKWTLRCENSLQFLFHILIFVLSRTPHLILLPFLSQDSPRQKLLSPSKSL